MTQKILGIEDASLAARVVRRTPLLYATGADAALDRPAHVRAGSSIVRVGRRLAVVQDDANFLALVDADAVSVRAVTLPAGADGKRQFDDVRGNKRFKLDLEAAVVVPAADGDWLLAFGSGSTPVRETIAVFRGWGDAEPYATMVDARALYAALRAETDFAGSELNVEGAALVHGAVRLFNRGNGAPTASLLPVDATCDLDLAALLAYLGAPESSGPPRISRVVQYELGSIGGARLTFTDAVAAGSTVLFSAAAEESPDATRDGPVAGSALGVIGRDGVPRWTVVADADGRRFAGKIEGLVPAEDDPARLFVVLDLDDPAAPSELCEVELGGDWGSGAG
ncbi:MAG TPA: hypothetical protein VFE05_13090 [Longimicrobiaceae bacterium]|jgi:hypothetical protein|nr:hypothetical protein [Longimicrobiaceae bacterium]